MFCVPGLVFGGNEGVGSHFHVLPSELGFSITEGVGSRFHVLRSRLVFDGTEGVGYRFHVLHSQTRFRRYRGRGVPFSCFALPDSFSAVPRASGLVFMFCAPVLVFGGNEDVGSHFHILRSRTHFRRYRGCRVQYSCFALPDSFSTLPRVPGPVFMFCAPGLVFRETEGVGYRFRR
jgi:hypothetical protein